MPKSSRSRANVISVRFLAQEIPSLTVDADILRAHDPVAAKGQALNRVGFEQQAGGGLGGRTLGAYYLGCSPKARLIKHVNILASQKLHGGRAQPRPWPISLRCTLPRRALRYVGRGPSPSSQKRKRTRTSS